MSTWIQSSPVGAISITLGPNGMTRVQLPAVGFEFLAPDLGKRDPTNKKSRREEAIGRQFDEYFAGTRHAFDIPIDLPQTLTVLQRRILLTLRDQVVYGETVTYGELAEMAGRPGAARAVGSTMARNPLPLLIPCHRVVAASGIGGYGGAPGGVALKRVLLDLEGGRRPTR